MITIPPYFSIQTSAPKDGKLLAESENKGQKSHDGYFQLINVQTKCTLNSIDSLIFKCR